jgi:hypothetical protein
MTIKTNDIEREGEIGKWQWVVAGAEVIGYL